MEIWPLARSLSRGKLLGTRFPPTGVSGLPETQHFAREGAPCNNVETCRKIRFGVYIPAEFARLRPGLGGGEGGRRRPAPGHLDALGAGSL